MGNISLEELEEAQNLLLEIYNAVGLTAPSDIPNDDIRDKIYAAWFEIGDFLTKKGVSLVY